MSPFRAFKILFALAFGASLPTMVALLYYLATGDPTARPLGLSSAAIDRFFGLRESNAIEVIVATGSDVASANTPLRAEQLLTNSLVPYGVPFSVRHFSTSGRGVQVTFRIGATVLGPYPMAKSAHGISAALAAYQMNMRVAGKPTPTGRFLDP